MAEIHTELPYPPSLNALYRTVRGRVLLSREGREYKARIAALLRLPCFRPLVGPVAVTVRAYRPQRRGDLDNTLKALLDSVQGLLYENDSQIVELHAHRLDDARNPRVVLTVRELEP